MVRRKIAKVRPRGYARNLIDPGVMIRIANQIISNPDWPPDLQTGYPRS